VELLKSRKEIIMSLQRVDRVIQQSGIHLKQAGVKLMLIPSKINASISHSYVTDTVTACTPTSLVARIRGASTVFAFNELLPTEATVASAATSSPTTLRAKASAALSNMAAILAACPLGALGAACGVLGAGAGCALWFAVSLSTCCFFGGAAVGIGFIAIYLCGHLSRSPAINEASPTVAQHPDTVSPGFDCGVGGYVEKPEAIVSMGVGLPNAVHLNLSGGDSATAISIPQPSSSEATVCAGYPTLVPTKMNKNCNALTLTHSIMDALAYPGVLPSDWSGKAPMADFAAPKKLLMRQLQFVSPNPYFTQRRAHQILANTSEKTATSLQVEKRNVPSFALQHPSNTKIAKSAKIRSSSVAIASILDEIRRNVPADELGRFMTAAATEMAKTRVSVDLSELLLTFLDISRLTRARDVSRIEPVNQHGQFVVGKDIQEDKRINSYTYTLETGGYRNVTVLDPYWGGSASTPRQLTWVQDSVRFPHIERLPAGSRALNLSSNSTGVLEGPLLTTGLLPYLPSPQLFRKMPFRIGRLNDTQHSVHRYQGAPNNAAPPLTKKQALSWKSACRVPQSLGCWSLGLFAFTRQHGLLLFTRPVAILRTGRRKTPSCYSAAST
jgi:hypothetical protein